MLPDKQKTMDRLAVMMWNHDGAELDILRDCMALLAGDGQDELKTEREEQEFIVAYAPTWCNIAAAKVDKDMAEMFRFATNRLNHNWDDIVPYNNQFWGCVKAVNAKNAFDKFMAKFREEWKGDR